MPLDNSSEMTTEHFLRKIISPDGILQVTTIEREGGAKNHPCVDFENMVDKLTELDCPPVDVYHACGTFHDPESRKADNVKSMKSFYLDIDCGTEKAESGKGYSTKEVAREALAAFCQKCKLPEPMLVDSGGGLHIYWPLKEPISREVWQGVAGKLKALTKAHGFLVDQNRTADAASILRPIGHMNRKYDPPRAVKLLSDADCICFVLFSAAIEQGFELLPSGSLRSKAGCVAGLNATAPELAEAVNPNGFNLVEIEEALRKIDPWCDRSQWMSIGMALADAFGEGARGLFTRWSRGDLQGEQK